MCKFRAEHLKLSHYIVSKYGDEAKCINTITSETLICIIRHICHIVDTLK